MLPKKSISMDHAHYSPIEELLNASTHALGFCLAIVGLVALSIKSDSTVEYITALIYATSLAAMFISSTIYHSVKDVYWRKILRKIDHTAIYLLIAGTYTPFMVLAVGGWIGTAAMITVWSIAIAGIVFKTTIGHRYPKISVTTYAALGWFAILLIYPIYQALSAGGFTLLVAGGLCYSAGIPFYMLKSRHYTHAIWHLFVVAGAACHFFAIYYHVV
ncbi:PAQR family membrane homeostasis protein TrhA [Alteromonas flava]|uniref:PAQR family membrane homeostasis protein TrhA n=1 Tax=Alteromonas flava TaxID=2048003 RepID=UPI000C28693B|nr:hemolysin III family protein [Alteromonas flava]